MEGGVMMLRYSFLFLLVQSFGNFVAEAESLVVPNFNQNTVGSQGLIDPFRDTGARYQQFYSASEFGSIAEDVIAIKELRFRIDESNSLGLPFSTIAHGLSILMSTTPKDYNSVSTTLAANYGPDLSTVLPQQEFAFNGTHTSPTSFDVVIPLPNQFVYDRRSGNLLVEFQISGSSNLPLLDGGGGPIHSVFNINGVVGFSVGNRIDGGLITQFSFEPVPEPQIGPLLGIGLGTILAVIKRQKMNTHSALRSFH